MNVGAAKFDHTINTVKVNTGSSFCTNFVDLESLIFNANLNIIVSSFKT